MQTAIANSTTPAAMIDIEYQTFIATSCRKRPGLQLYMGKTIPVDMHYRVRKD